MLILKALNMVIVCMSKKNCFWCHPTKKNKKNQNPTTHSAVAPTPRAEVQALHWRVNRAYSKRKLREVFPLFLLHPPLCVEGTVSTRLQSPANFQPFRTSTCVAMVTEVNCIFNYLYIFMFVIGFVQVICAICLFSCVQPHYLYLIYEGNNSFFI